MPSVVRLADYCSGHSCYPPRQNVQGSSNVFVNDAEAHRQSDLWDIHCCPDVGCHNGVLAKGSTTVFVNSLELARLGDPISCGSVAIQGSQNVFCGD